MWFSIASLKPNSGIQYVGYSFLLLASLLWAIFFVLYALKIVFRWNDFRKEFASPISMNLFASITMTMLAISVGCLNFSRILAEAIWWVATPFQTFLALYITTQWVISPRTLQNTTPHMFLPVVGLALIPISGASFGFAVLGYLFFGTAMLFWILLFAIFLQRFFLFGVLPPKLVPAMFISVAPPCLLGLAYVKLNGVTDPTLPLSLYGVAAFFVAFMFILRLRHVSSPLSTSWWAYVFPLANFGAFTVWWYGYIVSTSPTVSYGFFFWFPFLHSGVIGLVWSPICIVCSCAGLRGSGMNEFLLVFFSFFFSFSHQFFFIRPYFGSSWQSFRFFTRSDVVCISPS